MLKPEDILAPLRKHIDPLVAAKGARGFSNVAAALQDALQKRGVSPGAVTVIARALKGSLSKVDDKNTYSDVLSSEGWVDSLVDYLSAYFDPADWSDLVASSAMGASTRVTKLKPDLDPGVSKDDAIFDDYLFADERESQGVPAEPDNDAEAAAWQSMLQHVQGNGDMKGPGLDALRKIAKSGAYPEFFHPPTETLYRGFSGISSTTLAMLERILGRKNLPPSGREDVSAVVRGKPKSEDESSWTNNWTVAANFARDEIGGGIAVVFAAEPGDNPGTFIEGPGGFYKLPYLDVFSRERESIALGPVKISAVYWADRGKDEDLPDSPDGKFEKVSKPRIDAKFDESLLRRYIKSTLLG